MEFGEVSEVREFNTDVEVDDILRKQTFHASTLKSRVNVQGQRNSHTLGSLLELSHKLQETEKRYRNIIKSMEIDCKSTGHEIQSSNSITARSLISSQALTAPNLCKGQTNDGRDTYGQQHNPEDFSFVRNHGAAIAHKNDDDYSRKLLGSFITNYSNGEDRSFSKNDDHHHLGKRTGLDVTNTSSLLSNAMTPASGSAHSSTAQAKSDLVLSERRKHRCQMCSYQTDNISHLRRHQCTVHNADKLYHCYVCGMDFSRSERAKAHFLTIHPEIPYHSKIARKRPIENIGENLVIAKVTKPEVQFHAAEKAPVLKHDNVTMATRKVWEKYCRLVAPSNGTGSYHFECVQCEYQGPNIWHLKRHYLDTHVSSGSYSCRVCHYSTGDMQRLISHMTGHGELFCSRCSFSTVELERFRTHLPLCTGTGVDELAQCPVCGIKFSDRVIVKRHVTVSHMREYCELCGCVIYGTGTIEEHQRQHHSSQSDWNGSASEGMPAQQDTKLGIPEPSVGLQPNSSENNLEKDDAEGQISTDGMNQAKIRFGRFSNQVYYCPVEACGFKATWKKSVELHMLNYHGCGNADGECAETGVSMSDQSAMVASGVPPLYGLFNCAFCPNYRTFKYRKSFEKHLLQHGIDYEKHPYLVVRCTQLEGFGPTPEAASV